MKKRGFLHLIINTLILIVVYLFYEINLSLEIYEILLIIVFLYACVVSMLDKFFNIFQIFLGTYFIFNISRIFMSALSIDDYRELDLFYSGYLSTYEATELLKFHTFFIIAILFAWFINLILFKENSKPTIKKSLLRIKPLVEIGLIIYYILFLVKTIITIKLIRQYGYLYIFTGGISNHKYPYILSGVENITRFLFIVYVYLSRENINKFLGSGYLLILLIGMLTGQRGPGLVTLILITWLYSKRFKKIKIRHVFLISIFGIFMTRFIAIFRYNTNEAIIDNILFKFLHSQGISLHVLSYLIRYKDSLVHNGKVYFFHYFKILFSPNQGGQTIERLSNSLYLGDQLTYFLSPNIYLAGRGTGTSLIAEFYDLANANLVLFTLISFIFMLFSLWLSKKFEKNIFLFIVGFNYFFRFIYAPRDSIGKSLNFIKNDFILLMLLIVIAKVLYRKKEDVL